MVYSKWIQMKHLTHTDSNRRRRIRDDYKTPRALSLSSCRQIFLLRFSSLSLSHVCYANKIYREEAAKRHRQSMQTSLDDVHHDYVILNCKQSTQFRRIVYIINRWSIDEIPIENAQ